MQNEDRTNLQTSESFDASGRQDDGPSIPDEKWLESFYKECGREVTLAYTTLNQMKNWAMTVTAAAITGIAFGSATVKYPDERMFIGVVIVYSFVLRFFIRAIICYVNLTRWNNLQDSCISYKLQRRIEGEQQIADDVALNRLATNIRDYYQRWISPIDRPTQVISNLKLGFALLFALPLFFLVWGVSTLWTSPLVQALTVFSVGSTVIEFADFGTNIIFDDRNARAKRDEKHKRKKEGSKEVVAFPTPSTRSYYMTSWIVLLLLSISVAVVQESRSHANLPSSQPGIVLYATDGTLNVTSNPVGAIIVVDGKHLGFTPATLHLSSGAHLVSLALPGFIDASDQLTISAGGEQTYSRLLIARQSSAQMVKRKPRLDQK